MKGEGVGRTSMHDDSIHPHPALLSCGRPAAGKGCFCFLVSIEAI